MSLNELKNIRIDYENDIAIVQLNQENSKVIFDKFDSKLKIVLSY